MKLPPSLSKAIEKQDREELKRIENELTEKLSKQPYESKLWYFKSLVEFSLDNFPQMRSSIEQSLSLEGLNAHYRTIYGLALEKLQLTRQAMAEYEKAIECNPQFYAPYDHLARIYSSPDYIAKGIPHCERLIQNHGHHLQPQAFLSILQIFTAHFRLKEARALLEQLCRSQPKEPIWALQYSLLESLQGNDALALKHIRRSIALAPQDEKIQLRLANEMWRLGSKEECKKAYYKVIEEHPKSLTARVNFLLKFPQEAREEDRIALENFQKCPLSSNDKADLHFALAALAHEEKDYAKAQTHTDQACRHFKQHRAQQGWGYDFWQHHHYIERFEQATQKLPNHPAPSSSWTPLFIVGMPRSGTTLAEQILASHSYIDAAGELDIIRQSLNDVETTFPRYSSYVEALPHLTEEDLRPLAAKAESKYRALYPKTRFITDKMPANRWHLNWIASLFPQAKIIYCKRDPRNVALSCWRQRLPRLNWAHDLWDITHRILSSQHIMNVWKETIPLEICEIQYEELVEDFETQVRRLIDFCGLPWEEGCLTFYNNSRAIRTASTGQVSQPIYRTSLDSWKNYQSALAPMEPLLYDPKRTQLDSRHHRILSGLIENPLNLELYEQLGEYLRDTGREKIAPHYFALAQKINPNLNHVLT